MARYILEVPGTMVTWKFSPVVIFTACPCILILHTIQCLYLQSALSPAGFPVKFSAFLTRHMLFALNFNNCTLTPRKKYHWSVLSIFPWCYWTSHSCILPSIHLQSYSHYFHRYVLLKILTSDSTLGCLIRVKLSWMWIQLCKWGGILECHYPHDPWDCVFLWLKYGWWAWSVTFHALWFFLEILFAIL